MGLSLVKWSILKIYSYILNMCHRVSWLSWWKRRRKSNAHCPLTVFSAASVSRHWALNCRQTRPTETWYFMFLEARFLTRSYQEGETQRSWGGCGAGTEQVPTISPVCLIPRAPAAILHFTSNCSHICSTFTDMKPQTTSGLSLHF